FGSRVGGAAAVSMEHAPQPDTLGGHLPAQGPGFGNCRGHALDPTFRDTWPGAAAQRRTASGVSGRRSTAAPARASATALVTAAPAPVQPPSPTPLTPRGFRGGGTPSITSVSSAETSAAVGIRLSMKLHDIIWSRSS